MEGQSGPTQKKRRRFPWMLGQWLFPLSAEALAPVEVKAPPIPSSTEPATQNEQIKPPTTIWNVPHCRNVYFTGREDLLNRLHEHFTRAKTAALAQPLAITGLGGIGKTQVAVEYAYRHKAAYRYILWINAASRETLIEGFLTVARLLALPTKDEQDQHMIVAAVQHWLKEHRDWLLILDNADDAGLASEFLPTGASGHVLLTTCEPAWGSIAHSFEVEKMSQTEGVLFLLRRAKVIRSSDISLSQASRSDQMTAAALVREFDGLPLALDQAGAYLEEKRSALSAYLNAYTRRRADFLFRRGRTPIEYLASVATTWSLAFEQVEQRDPLAADLLYLLAFLAPDTIPEDLIVGGATELGPQLQALAADETRFDGAVGLLLRFSLVQRNTDQHLLFIHRLVQAVLRAKMTNKAQHEWAERAVRAVNLAFPEMTDVALWERGEHYLPHALVCWKLIEAFAFEFAEASCLLSKVAYYLYRRAQYHQAEPLYQRALSIREKQLGLQHPDTANSLNNLARLYRAQGKYEQAEPLYQRALSIREKQLGPQHPDTANSLNNLAALYYVQGKYQQAEPLYQRALAIYEKHLEPEHPNMALSLNNLAGLYDAQGKYEQAEPLYQRALALVEKQLGPEHPHTTTIRKNYHTLVENLKPEGKGMIQSSI